MSRIILEHDSLFFQDWPIVLDLGSSSTCIEVRGSERGKAASNFSRKLTSIPEGSRSCSGAHCTPWKEFSGFLVTYGWRVGSRQQNNEVLLYKRVLPPVKHFSGK